MYQKLKRLAFLQWIRCAYTTALQLIVCLFNRENGSTFLLFLLPGMIIDVMGTILLLNTKRLLKAYHRSHPEYSMLEMSYPMHDIQISRLGQPSGTNTDENPGPPPAYEAEIDASPTSQSLDINQSESVILDMSFDQNEPAPNYVEKKSKSVHASGF